MTEDDVLRVSRSCVIPLSEIRMTAGPSGGPGGQHANRSHTKIEARFDVEASTALGPRQRARLMATLGPVVTAVAGDERSQTRNRDLALERLARRLADALRVPRPRRATKPTAGAVKRRLDSKRRRGDVKRLRRPLAPDG